MTPRLGSLARFVLPLVAVAAGCSHPAPQGQSSDVLTHGDPFVAIARTLDADTVAKMQARSAGTRGIESVPSTDSPQAFYLAIKKSELGQRWFLSAFLKQYFPDGVGGGAASSLGTRVVTFRVQNDKLFVFDASDNYAASDTFDPELILEAYPLVGNYGGFSSLAGNADYVLFDPAAGLNRFDIFFGDYQSWWGSHFQIDFAFLQNFRKTADGGATFEEVFSGASNDVPVGFSYDVANNLFRGQGTLSLALRRYSEGAGFVSKQAPYQGTAPEYFFRSDTHILKNTGEHVQSWVRWNLKSGKPIKWLISADLLKAQTERYPDYDLVGAVKAGIESWNAVLGPNAIKAEVAKPTDSFADDDKNFFIFDRDPTYGYAFANWRLNPNSGEIRGASVYFNESWITGTIDYFTQVDGAGGQPRALKPAKKSQMVSFGWSKLAPKPLCTMSIDEVLAAAQHKHAGAASTVPGKRKEDVERLIQHVIAHEIGHTLGLRHNFKGSLAPPSSSVMDYISTDLRAQTPVPQPYDVAAIKYLYDLDPAAPTQAFCTDENTLTDPMCARFDQTADPLVNDYGPFMAEYTMYPLLYDWYLVDYISYYDPLWNDVLKFARAGSTEQQLQALDFIKANTAVGVVKPAGAVADYAARMNQLARIWIGRLNVDRIERRGEITAELKLTGAPLTKLVDELYGNLANSDGQREFATRRLVVDTLKKLQNDTALDALVRAKAAIAASRAGLTGAEAQNTDDLLVRINAALTPYYN
ncbi:MAG: hypothetical protein JWM53_968 [bacterium]|nr:hypothetical protein [bacterium]